MTEPLSTTSPYVWVDFNDTTRDGRLFAPLYHSTIKITGPGQAVVLGDHEGNRCHAVVESVDNISVRFRLEMDLFIPAQPGVRPPFAEALRARRGREIRQSLAGAAADPRDTLVDRMRSSIAAALHFASEHVDDPRAHDAVLGCPWCVDAARAEALFKRMAERWPDEWSTLDQFEARVLCARGDLARSEQ